MSKQTAVTLGGAALAIVGYVLCATVLKGSGYESEVVALLGYVGGAIGYRRAS